MVGLHTETLDLPGWTHVYSGKVRDLYRPADPGTTDRLLVVASNRLSSFDVMLGTEIPDKGAILTQLSLWWFEQLADLVPHHVIADAEVPTAVAGRATVCRSLDMYPLECIARGYLTGSGLKDYLATGAVCGITLPAGLADGSRLPQAIFTPSAKAAVGDHDENVTFEAAERATTPAIAAELRDLTLRLFTRAEDLARERGIILADTKFEFGNDPATGATTLGDEVLTPDSSRFWDAATWQPGSTQASFDKQFVRDWILSTGWTAASGEAPPPLPEQIVERTRGRYLEAFRRLTGREFSA
ncbi:phosphoribosylaminoimidazolesuccinocarboxamide synthase [Micrococcales bacterium 31B]|nr:phosphoribosylaminoimidazolesuccinocarboxamide synthase [Micrococcales bacterium 31B]